MANQPESPVYDAGVLQLETNDLVQGGVGGIDNAPLLNLANRTAYLKQHLDNLEAGNTVPPGVAVLNSPTFTGDPKSATPALGDNDTSLSTTAFVQGTVGGVLNKNVAGGVNVILTAAEAGNAILILSGVITANIAVIVPTAPTRAWFVKNNTAGAFSLTVKTAAGTGIAITQGRINIVFVDGANVNWAKTDIGDLLAFDGAGSGLDADLLDGHDGAFFAPIASPALSGIPTTPTPAPGTNNTQIANMAAVLAAVAAVPVPVTSVAGKIGSVTLAVADVAGAAPLASPAFTNTPTAPTPPLGTNTTQIANMAALQAALANSGGALWTQDAEFIEVAVDKGIRSNNVLLHKDGNIETATYGFLHNRFATKGSFHHDVTVVNCGNGSSLSTTAVGNNLTLTLTATNCACDCSNCNCTNCSNCNCDCTCTD